MGRVYYLLYVSTATRLFTRQDLDDLLAQCHRRNPELGVTGALLYRGGVFMQVLEGDRGNVEGLYETIKADRRHYDVSHIVDGETTERQFGEWSMAFRDISVGSDDDRSVGPAVDQGEPSAGVYSDFFGLGGAKAFGDYPTLAQRVLLRFR